MALSEEKIIDKFKRASIGLTDIDIELKGTTPPYNISSEDDITYLIEVAVAGYLKENLNVELNKNNLVITGVRTNPGKSYIIQGITQKQFRLTVPIGKSININSAKYKEGILEIELQRNVEEVQNINIT